MNDYPKLRGTIVAALLILSLKPACAQTSQNQPLQGPFWSGTIRGPHSDQTIAVKGIAITLGTEKNAFICFDTDLMRISLAWTGEFLEFGNTLTKVEWPPPPQVKGTPMFGVQAGPGWSKSGSFDDPRSNKQGPLPKEWAHYEGLYQNGDDVILRYNVKGTDILELPGFEKVGDQSFFTRTFQFSRKTGDLELVLADQVEGTTLYADFSGDAIPRTVKLAGDKSLAVGGVGLPVGTRLEVADHRLIARLATITPNTPFRLVFSSDSKSDGFTALRAKRPSDLRELCHGGARHWLESVITKGIRSAAREPYVVDTLTEPVNNPYNAKTFFGGFDFFSDGRAAICTFHGDVWIVSGIDDSLESLTWKRYATGLFQPLGLKIVKDTVYVLGRDQITRLLDLNKDGEADFYENFNNDVIDTPNYHEFCLDLQTDREGNFYFAKSAPFEPDVTSPHQGCLCKVSKDGVKFEIYATGFRAPNGMAIGPNDEITVSDNQGHWMPSSKLNWIEKGGFYGMTPSAQRTITLQRDGTNFTANPSDPNDRAKFNFKGWGDTSAPLPESYDKPFCWLPMSMDNSSGGQVWVTSDKWGPLKDHLLFMSYGKCTLFEVMPDLVDGTRQGAMVQFPFRLNSGVMRGRINPRDGQVYLCGLKGWQTSATRDGGFYRIRYTGETVRMPASFHAATDGVQISFTCPLDAKSATDPGNYSAERWDYHWTGSYGSPDFSVSAPEKKQHDQLDIKRVRLLPDGRTVALEIADMKPSDQMKIKFAIEAADGAAISQEVYATVYKLGSAQTAQANK